MKKKEKIGKLKKKTKKKTKKKEKREKLAKKSTNIILKNKEIKQKNYVEKHRSNSQYFKEKKL